MAKPRIILADLDEGYVISIQHKFIEEFFGKIELEIITDRQYFEELFETPQKADILVVSESLYDLTIQKHNICHIFLMTEQEEEGTADLKVNTIYKYTSIKEIFNEILGTASNSLNITNSGKKDPQIVVVTSAVGGVGKTTLAMGLSACLAKDYKKVLYINADYLQCFSHMLSNQTVISNNDVYSKLIDNSADAYQEVKYQIRNEVFSYLPPFKAALVSLGISSEIFVDIALSAKKSGNFDYIILDTDSVFDERKVKMIDVANRVMIITKQYRTAVIATNYLAASINGMGSEKYIFICNDFEKDGNNSLISPEINLKFGVNEYIDHISQYDLLKGSDFADQTSIRKIIYLLD